MILRSRFFWFFTLIALLLGVPSFVTWFRRPFIVTRYEYDFFLGWWLGESGDLDFGLLMFGKTLHLTLILLLGWAYYRLILSLADAKSALTWPQVVSAGALAIGITFFYIPWLSPDVFFYFGTGWLDHHYHANPYQTVIAELPGYETDPIFRNIVPAWKHITTPYGPLFVKFIAAVAAMGDGDDLACLLILKAFFVLHHVANAFLVHAIAVALNFKPRLAVVTYLLNPVPLLTYIGWAHNDVMMMTFLFAAVWAMITDRAILTTVCLGLGAGLKYVPILLFPLFFLYLVRRRSLGQTLLMAVLLGTILAGVVLLPNLAYEGGMQNFVRLFRGVDQLHRNFLYLFLAYHPTDPGPMESTKMVLKMLFLSLYALILGLVWKKRASLTSDYVLAAMVLALLLYFVIGSPEIHEWYMGWFLCLVFWIDDLTYFNVGMILSILMNALVIFEVRSTAKMEVLVWEICFLVMWAVLFYIYRKNRMSGERKHSPLTLGAGHASWTADQVSSATSAISH
jgi:hypothetical protein